ncbi:MAG: MmgE/PrpD family protein [Tateyamaria sp.]
MSTDFMEQIAGFAAGSVTPSAAASQVALLSALDWIAVGLAGAQEPVSGLVRDMVLEERGVPQASLFGCDTQVPARAAALVNGTTSHALDYDDTHFAHIGHPSVAVFPAALAIAEQQDAKLSELMEAALVGMETSIRIGLWLGRGHYQVGFHQTATAGAFGATVAAARLLGMDAERMPDLLGLTATRSAGLKAQFGTMGKPYNAGLAAATGVECARLVAAGFVSNPAALDGPFGFGATHHGAGDVETALAEMDEEWLFEEVSHKFHACCHGLHAALEAARTLDLAGPEIAELTVRTHPRWMSVCNQVAPDTGLGAKFSYGTVLAMLALGHDTARLDSYRDALCVDPGLVALRQKVQVVEDDSLSETQAVLTVLRRDGAQMEAAHDLLTPMSLSERENRVRTKARALIGADQADAAWSLLSGDARARDLARMVRG